MLSSLPKTKLHHDFGSCWQRQRIWFAKVSQLLPLTLNARSLWVTFLTTFSAKDRLLRSWASPVGDCSSPPSPPPPGEGGAVARIGSAANSLLAVEAFVRHNARQGAKLPCFGSFTGKLFSIFLLSITGCKYFYTRNHASLQYNTEVPNILHAPLKSPAHYPLLVGLVSQ